VNLDKSRQVPPMDPATPEEEFEKLRQHFHERLRKEQKQLAALSEALEGPVAAPAATLVDIREFAHRLRGAALVFGFQDLGDVAKNVELAAIAASLDLDCQWRDPSVISTMRELGVSLAAEIGTGASCTSTLTHATGSSSRPSSW
jgi:HPt (histidine-containing phosphotransfer) domain-containing protein